MSWFRVDDKFHGHAKVKRLPRSIRAAALGTWILGGTWAADQEKDGYVPSYVIDDLGGTIEGAEALVEVGLWRKRRDGYVFINWAEYQPTRADNEKRREETRNRVAAHRARKNAENPGDGTGSVTRYSNGVRTSRSRPDPSRPDDEPLDPAAAHETPPPPVDRSVQKARRNPTGIDEPRIVARLEEIVGDTAHVSVIEARLVAEHFTARAKGDVQRPTAFVLGCITRHENAVANFLQTGRWSE